MESTLTARPDEEPEPTPVVVLATTAESTRHALPIARAIGADRHAAIDVVASQPEKVTISSSRANVHDLPVDMWDPHPLASPDVVRALAAQYTPGARVTVGPVLRLRGIRKMLPPHATVILAGPVRHFLESPEQRLARHLTEAGYDVVFVPSRDCETHS